MKSATGNILNLSVTAPFYRQHAGIFLFSFLILFGIQPSFADALRAHYFIIQYILTSPDIFLLALLAWSLYALKTVLYFRSCLAKETYNFIFLFNAMPPSKKFIHLARLQLSLFAPVLVYGIVIMLVAWKERLPLGALQSAFAIMALYFASTAACYYLLQQAKAIQAITRSRFFLRLPRKLFVFLLRFMFVRQFPALLLVKLLSFFSLYIFSRTESSVFEDRMLWLIYITALIGHSVIIYRNFHFMERELRFYRNLPVKNHSTLLSLLVVYCLILIPEIWALRGVAIVQDQTAGYVWMLITGPALLLLLHCLLYTEDMKMEEFLKLLFGVWVVFIFFSLSVNRWLMPLIGFVFAVIIFRISYRHYEKEAAVEKLD